MAFIILWHDDGPVDTVCCSVEFSGTEEEALVIMGSDTSAVECPRAMHLGTFEAENLPHGAERFFPEEE